MLRPTKIGHSGECWKKRNTVAQGLNRIVYVMVLAPLKAFFSVDLEVTTVSTQNVLAY